MGRKEILTWWFKMLIIFPSLLKKLKLQHYGANWSIHNALYGTTLHALMYDANI